MNNIYTEADYWTENQRIAMRGLKLPYWFNPNTMHIKESINHINHNNIYNQYQYIELQLNHTINDNLNNNRIALLYITLNTDIQESELSLLTNMINAASQLKQYDFNRAVIVSVKTSLNLNTVDVEILLKALNQQTHVQSLSELSLKDIDVLIVMSDSMNKNDNPYNIKYIQSPSVTTLLNTPSLKRDVWQQLNNA